MSIDMTRSEQKFSVIFMASAALAVATGSCVLGERQDKEKAAEQSPVVASVSDFSQCFEAAVRERKLAGVDTLNANAAGAQALTWSKVAWSDTEGFSGTQSTRPVQSLTVETTSVTKATPLTRSTIVSEISLPDFSIVRKAPEPHEALTQDASAASAMVQHSDYINIARYCALGLR